MLDITLCGCDKLTCTCFRNIFCFRRKKRNVIYKQSDTKTILCRPLSEQIDVNRLFEENPSSLNLIVNNQNVIISTSSQKQSILSVPSSHLINKHIDELHTCLPAELILILEDIIEKTKSTNESFALVIQVCENSKKPAEYILCSFPIINKNQQFGILLIHSPLNLSIDRSSLLTKI